MRPVPLIGVATFACVVGIVSGRFLCASASFRNALGEAFGRGHLVSVVHGAGVYERDITDASPKEKLIAGEQVAFESRAEKVSSQAITHEFGLLHDQLLDRESWSAAMHANRLCSWTLRLRIAKDLRARQWIERQLANQVDPTDDECRVYFSAHSQEFAQPQRFRVAHLFLAAPDDTPQEAVDLKRRSIEQLLERLDNGEKFSDLVTAFSEDEATKNGEGDLGYFSDFRMPADFVSAVRQLHVGEMSRVVQTALGFHILRLTDVKPARQMEFAETQPEIRARLTNEKRRSALRGLVADASRKALPNE